MFSCGSIQTINGVRIEENRKKKSSEEIFLWSALGSYFVLYGITNSQPYK